MVVVNDPATEDGASGGQESAPDLVEHSILRLKGERDALAAKLERVREILAAQRPPLDYYALWAAIDDALDGDA